jgi:hypothetical protein
MLAMASARRGSRPDHVLGAILACDAALAHLSAERVVDILADLSAWEPAAVKRSNFRPPDIADFGG